MKVLQVVNSYVHSGRSGGPVRMMYDYARRLVVKGHSVTVFTTDFMDYGARIKRPEETLMGVNVRYFRRASDLLSRRNAPLSFGMYRALKEGMRDYDVVHICETRGALPVSVHRHAKRYGVPLAHSAFGMLPMKRGLLRKAYDLRYVRPMIRDSALLLAQTENEVMEYLKMGADPGKVRLLPLGVDMEAVRAAPRGAFRERFGIPMKAPLLLFLGRIHPLKGLIRLLGVLQRASIRLPGLRLAVTGADDGALRETVRRARAIGVAERVTFTGPLYGEERFQAYTDADLFVITPTNYEETSLASVEAMACGTPVLVSREAEVPYLEEYGAGICLAFAPEVFADAAVGLFNDRERLAAMGENAVRLVGDRLNSKVVGARLEGYLRDVAGEA